MSPSEFKIFIAESFEKIRKDSMYSYSSNNIDSVHLSLNECIEESLINVSMEDGTSFDISIKESKK